ncbi:hypothetical protein [Granulosicoccus antarcticus]|uniref:Uncharacterized protein n=1 Tax=Granulosicoccus antarcticus IMCC3135 TaxID=1192854 RepID=A0A2Z2NY42_9GAMM|nr:hypothetical protein [Granulosicoccus antarcticus]ASJ76203.1 hypothetical protein IMCC3135_30770 [Granulosicoccus antarcticus IMCC3135]
MPGPNTLFDKSFLQSLSEDEALWFDYFFIANVCPLFFVETLADLEKSTRQGRSPEREVAIIASKTPSIQGAPNVHHEQLCKSELLGHKVPLTGQIIIAEGKFVKNEDGNGVYVPVSPEAKAFTRWKEGLYEQVERESAKNWRDALKSVDLPSLAEASRSLYGQSNKPRNIDEAWSQAQYGFRAGGDKYEQIRLIVSLLRLDGATAREFMEIWRTMNNPPLSKYAPYCAYVGTVKLFFRIALAAGLISDQRASNQVDLAYLYYLPFCHAFVSSDKLHRTIAEGALRKDQMFAWGIDVKNGLKEINEYFNKLPVETKKLGIFAFAHRPPAQIVNNPAIEIWDRLIPQWRESAIEGVVIPKQNEELRQRMQAVVKGKKTAAPGKFSSDNVDSMVMKRELPVRRGSWQIIEQSLADSQVDE